MQTSGLTLLKSILVDLALGTGDGKTNDSRTVIVLRDLYDSIISGYLYHLR